MAGRRVARCRVRLDGRLPARFRCRRLQSSQLRPRHRQSRHLQARQLQVRRRARLGQAQRRVPQGRLSPAALAQRQDLGLALRDLGRGRVITRSARPRPGWVQPAEARVQASLVRPDRAHLLVPVPVRPVSRPAALAVPAVLAAPAVRDRKVSVRRVAGQPAVPVTRAGRAVRAPVVRVRARAACRHGPSPGAAVPAAVPADLVVAVASAPGRAAVVAVLVVAAAVAQARRVPGPVQPGQVPAAVAVAAPRAPSAVQAGAHRAAGSRRSSVVKSSTTCRRRQSAACRSRAATGR
jgi:hypothetical protein